MFTRDRCLRIFVLAGVVAFSLAASFAQAAEVALRFDCGTAETPVMVGYQRLTGEDVYEPAAGRGWEGCRPTSVAFGSPEIPEGKGSAGRPDALQEYLEASYDDLNRDGVVSESDLVFRADVPAGTYRVTLQIGDMSKAIGSMDVYVNGELAEERVAAWTPGTYRFLLRGRAGWWTYVRKTVKADGGVIRVALKKNQSYYDEQMAEQETWDNPTSVYWAKDWNEKVPPYSYIGWPFVHNSLMAIEIVPNVPAPVVGKDDKLTMTRACASPALGEAISRFNAGDFEGAVGALREVKEPQAQVPKAIVELWLAGRPELELEDQLVPEAIGVLREYVKAHPEENGVGELLQDAQIFQRALVMHLTRGQLRKGHFIENDKAIGLWWMLKESSPLYYKSRIYVGQAGHMLLPYVPALGLPRQVFEELEKKFPDNRYVKYFLHWEWEPHGDGTHRTDWYLPDYYSRMEGTPEWARLLASTYGTMVDWSEYWMKFKQQPGGNIGGGWGDDVEIVGAFGYIGFISRGVSEISMQGLRKFMDGLLENSEVDPELGYCLPMADAEHSAEWTGNTLGMMVQIDYGNPLWIERSMKTAKLMRDLWTDYNANGHRHFRGNFFGAAQVGVGERANDSWINYRAIRPAAAVLAYNGNPAIREWFIEMGDAWYAAAMSTDRGKPKGVIPAQVSFPEGLLGGISSPNWYTASHPEGTVNYDWPKQSYKGYMQDLLMTAFAQTRDPKYLEPLQLEYELAARHGYTPEVGGGVRLGKAPWLKVESPTRSSADLLLKRWTPPKREEAEVQETKGAGGTASAEGEEASDEPPAEEGSEQWVASELKGAEAWLKAKRLMEGRRGELVNDITKQQFSDHLLFGLKMTEMNWPLMTTQTSATDRVPIGGLLPMLFTYTGGTFGGPLLRVPVTYVNTTEWFAAAVMASDPQGLRILYHSLAPDSREIGIVPWELESRGTYRLTYGPDVDENEVMDSILEKREFVWPQAGTPINLTIEPRVTYIIEVDQVKRGEVAELAPDPGLSPSDIKFVPGYNLLLATVHNVGSEAVRGVKVDFYDGDPADGGELIGSGVVPNIEAPNGLEPRSTTVGINWDIGDDTHEVYVVLDSDDDIEDEITTFNNVAQRTLPEDRELTEDEELKAALSKAFGPGGP